LLSCLTHTERLSLWSLDGEKLKEFGFDIRNNLSTEKFSVNYFVGCNYDVDLQQLFLVAGNHEGTLGIFHISNDFQITLVSVLYGGHTATVRSFDWNTKTQRIITSAEDSRICVWSTTSIQDMSIESGTPGKIPSPKRFQVHDNKPY